MESRKHERKQSMRSICILAGVYCTQMEGVRREEQVRERKGGRRGEKKESELGRSESEMEDNDGTQSKENHFCIHFSFMYQYLSHRLTDFHNPFTRIKGKYVPPIEI